jgi:acetyl esterase/lipase
MVTTLRPSSAMMIQLSSLAVLLCSSFGTTGTGLSPSAVDVSYYVTNPSSTAYCADSSWYKLDYYVPDNSNGITIVYLHGGGWAMPLGSWSP